MIKVLLADDHVLMRRGIRDLLETDPEIEVIAEAGDGREALQLTQKLKPDVLIIDLTMPELNGLDAIRLIRKEAPQVELLVFSMHDSEDLIREVLSAGARGYVLKSDAALYLVEAVKSLARHRPFFTPRISEAILNTLVTSAAGPAETTSSGPLSAREREILGLEFELAADIVRTAIAPSWTDIGQLGAIALIRTFLNYFLERDVEKYGEEQALRTEP